MTTPLSLITSTGVNAHTDIPSSHFCIHNAQIMAMTHNLMIRGLNSVYASALQVQSGTQDAADLLTYCDILYDFVHNHHEMEEVTYFPALEKAAGKPGLMAGNVEQHRAFEEGLEIFRDYAMKTSKEAYSGQRLRRIIEGFAEPFSVHLREEVGTILELKTLKSEDVEAAYRRMESEARKRANAFKVPLVFGCQDKEFLLDGEKFKFPEVPSFLPWLVHYVFSWRYAGAFRFNPSDAWGRPQKSFLD